MDFCKFNKKRHGKLRSNHLTYRFSQRKFQLWLATISSNWFRSRSPQKSFCRSHLGMEIESSALRLLLYDFIFTRIKSQKLLQNLSQGQTQYY